MPVAYSCIIVAGRSSSPTFLNDYQDPELLRRRFIRIRQPILIVLLSRVAVEG